MKLPWNDEKKQEQESVSAASAGTARRLAKEQPGEEQKPLAAETSETKPQESQQTSKAYTPKKGHATPSRKQAQQHLGTFESRYAPQGTYSENRKKRKELKASMSAEQWRDYKKKEKQERQKQQREAQAAMDRGEEKYLLARDKGPERRFVRDFIDSRRYLNNYVMPFAIVLLLILIIGQRMPQIASIISLVAMIIMLIFFAEGIWLGRAAARATKAKFPDTTESGFGLGFYAYGRATQPRKWRTPKPRVSLGEKVS
ncbi:MULTISPECIES: DUF3043 domain-containing protein [unclassified Corynebacterium]|uniref:DUF3043 domain-containing protein n=1 Tax=unclassified Corynebacterium TaxID=2624378 RepID=UPI00163D5C85|nr:MULTISPECIES: DUF3043 domain-containing protein [unclassified Corynebacterium]